MPLFQVMDASGTFGQPEWSELYFGLAKGASTSTPMPSMRQVRQIADQHRRKGMTPIALANFRYETVDTKALASALKEGGNLKLPGGSFKASSRCFASAILPEAFNYLELQRPRHYGQTVRFVIPANLYLTNQQGSVSNLVIDCDDGTGPRKTSLDEAFEVFYSRPGTKRIQLQGEIGSEAFQTEFAFEVAVSTAPPPDEILVLDSSVSFNDEYAKGHAWIYYGSENGVKHTAVTNPLIISEGFPGNYSLDYLWWALNDNSQGLLQNILNAGKDVVILGYEDGTTYLEANAGVVMACIDQVINERQGSDPLTVGGACMGGVITRFALALMEVNGLDHQTNLYFSGDSPHMGISVPASALYMGGALAEFSNYFDTIYEKLISPAGQELMLYTTTWWFEKPTAPPPLRTTFMQNLANVGSFPKKPKKVGFADGAGNGQGNSTPPGVNVVYAEKDDLVVYLYSAPGDINDDNLFFSVEDVLNCYWPLCPANFDSAPGSVETYFGQIATALGTTTPYQDASFVPTISALSMSGLDPYNEGDLYTNILQNPPASDLDDYYVGTENLGHMNVTPDLANWLIGQLTASVKEPSVR